MKKFKGLYMLPSKIPLLHLRYIILYESRLLHTVTSYVIVENDGDAYQMNFHQTVMNQVLDFKAEILSSSLLNLVCGRIL